MQTVSVVIPTYNQGSWILRTLDALAQQTRLPEQVIVVDDGSTDNTGQLLNEAMATMPFALTVVHQKNGGPGAARNRGIQEAIGSVIAFTDSDAVPRARWLEHGLARLAAESDACAGVEGRVEDDAISPPTIRTHQIHNLHGGRYLTCNMFYRRQLLWEVGGFHTRFREDSDLAFSLIEAGYQIVFEPRAIVDHPPREGTTWEVFHLAKKRRNDGLLWTRHPKTARQHLGSLYPPSESLILIGEVITVVSLLTSDLAVALIGLVLLVFAVPRMVLASLEGRQYGNRDYATAIVIALTLPWANVYYRTWGLFRRPSMLTLKGLPPEA